MSQQAKPNPTHAEVDQARRFLGLPEYATMDEIKKAYREVALRYHPDKCPEAQVEFCKEQMQRLNQAYQILLDFCANYRYWFGQQAEEEDRARTLQEQFYSDWQT